MKGSICIAVIACLFGGCATDGGPANYDPQTARRKIVAALPAGWSAVLNQDELQQRFTEAYFTGARNEAFILVGPQPNYLELTDHEGKTHREYLPQECLYLWIVPGDFEPRFEHLTLYNFFDPPWHPRPVFASRSVRVY